MLLGMSSATFLKTFGHPPEFEASAPGRVNLIGEHTDYNDGFVLPTAIPQRTHVWMSKRDDDLARVHAANLSQTLEYTVGNEVAGKGWLDYVQGVTHVLKLEGHHLQGHSVGGFEAVIHSDVPLGSGLSSSAALLVAMFRAVRQVFSLEIDDVTIARWSQTAENGFVGARVGIMDQMACSLADLGAALFLDCRSLEFERVPLPAGAELVVLHSGVEHNHAGGDYNTRRAECERACELLHVASLRDLEVRDLPRLGALPDIEKRRARHVITENARVLETVAAMRSGDLARIGALFYASHASMQGDYEVSLPEIDLIVNLARARPEIFGARLTGGGFGGSVVMLAHEGQGRAAGEAIAAEYATRSGRTPKLLTPTPA
jgi:galactokinase